MYVGMWVFAYACAYEFGCIHLAIVVVVIVIIHFLPRCCGVHSFGSFLHQHEHGKRIWTEQYRNSSLERVTARNDFWVCVCSLPLPSQRR